MSDGAARLGKVVPHSACSQAPETPPSLLAAVAASARPPAASAQVVVAVAAGARGWWAVITTNDRLRPRLYLGCGDRIVN